MGLFKVGSDSQDLKKIVREILVRYFQFLQDEPEFISLLMWENLNKGKFLAQHPNLLTKTPVLERLVSLLRTFRKTGQLSIDVDARHLLVLLSSVGFIYHANRYTIPHTMGLDIDSESVRRAGLEQAEDILLHGLLAR